MKPDVYLPRLGIVDGDEDWIADANCRGKEPSLFFPERGDSVAEAKTICRECAVRVDCLDYALVHHITFGIWGGETARGRRRMYPTRRRRVS